MKTGPLAIAAALMLSACYGDEAREAGPMTPPAEDACGASAYANLVGTAYGDQAFDRAARDLRIIAPDSVVTMDYRADRLNVDLDEDRIITRIWCG